YQMGVGYSSQQLESIRDRVSVYYEKEFIPRLNDHVSLDLTVEQYLPTHPRTLTLQDLYIASNPHPTGSKSELVSADESIYSKANEMSQTWLRGYPDRFAYDDVFLIGAATGDMLYSVFKELDFATNSLTGEYSNTNFGRLVARTVASTDKKFVKL